MKKSRANSHVVSVTVPKDILVSVDKYCNEHYIPRTSFFINAAIDFLKNEGNKDENKETS